MALINKFLPTKILPSSCSSKSDSALPSKRQNNYLETTKKSRNNQHNSNRSHSDTEDSNRLPDEGCSKIRMMLFRECEVRGRCLLFDSSTSSQCKDDFQELALMKDMVFGTATLKYFGENYRIHDFGNVQWKGYDMMLSKVFIVPPPQTQSIKAGKTSQTVQKLSISGGIAKMHNDTKDSGVSEGNTGWSSVSSFAAGPSFTSSQASFSSFSLAIPRIGSSRKAASDSFLSKPLGSKLDYKRKTRLAIALLFMTSDVVKEMTKKDIIFEHFSLIEHFVVRLQLGVLRAYSSRNNFTTFIHDAIRQFDKDFDNLCTPYIENPAYFELLPSPKCQNIVAHHLMVQMESIVTETDTKLTRFFWSCLLSAVLTYHVNWLHSFVSEPAECFDCGTRILVLSKDKSLARRLLYVLSYFVRDGVLVTQSNREATEILPSADASSVRKMEAVAGKKCDLNLFDTNCDVTSLKEYPSAVLIARNINSSLTSRSISHRNSQQSEHARYLRSYYDVRFQLSPGTITKKDNATFASMKYSIAKNDFQDFSFHESFTDSNYNSQPPANQCAFFIGSVPDQSAAQTKSLRDPSGLATAHLKPLEIPLPSFPMTHRSSRASRLSHWIYGSELNAEYQAGRVIQSCDPSTSDWLQDLHLDLRAAVKRLKTASCIVANTETWEIQVLTCVEEDILPTRTKQYWVPVTMSGQVAALVESTHLLWLMKQNAEECLDHVENRLRFLCEKSEDLSCLLSTSISSWNMDHVTRLLGVEIQDIPLLMAACSVHSPAIAQMGGVTVL